MDAEAKAVGNAWIHRYNTATYIRPLKDKWELCIIGVVMKLHKRVSGRWGELQSRGFLKSIEIR